MKSKQYFSSSGGTRHFNVNTEVYVRNFGPGPKWLPGVVTRITGPLSYVALLNDGRELRRHVDHMRIKNNKSFVDVIDVSANESMNVPRTPVLPTEASSASRESCETATDYLPQSPQQIEPNSIELRRSSRVRTKPDRLGENI